MFKRTVFFLVGCAIVASGVYALTHYDPGATDTVVLDEPVAARVVQSRTGPRTAQPPMNQWGRLDVLEEEPTGTVAVGLPLVTVEPSPRIRRAQKPNRPQRVAALNNDEATPPEPSEPSEPSERSEPPERSEPSEPSEPVARPEEKKLLRENLDRETVSHVMHSIRRAVQQCYDSGMVPGTVNLKLTVSGRSGRVLRSYVDESSSTARCIQQLASQLRFPRFAKPLLTIEYPYSFR
jgi:hypothetical protein